MTDKELVRSIGDKRLTCDRNCFALANRMLNACGYQARIEHLSEDEVVFVIIPRRAN